jgi:hypothetical protein
MIIVTANRRCNELETCSPLGMDQNESILGWRRGFYEYSIQPGRRGIVINCVSVSLKNIYMHRGRETQCTAIKRDQNIRAVIDR